MSSRSNKNVNNISNRLEINIVESENFNVYLIDLLGMGLSSRPEYKWETTNTTIDYFVDSLEEWRKALDLKTFSLGGHSFGGYMACQYVRKYQKYVTNLLLLSPLGMTTGDTLYTLDDEKNSRRFRFLYETSKKDEK